MSDIGRGFILMLHGKTYRCRPQEIPNFDEIVRQQVASERRLVKSAFVMEDGKTADVAVGSADSLCCTKLAGLRLDTWYSQVGEHLVPTFSTSGMRLTLEWEAPADMELRFASDCSYSGRLWRMGECFLFARKQNTPGFFRLPLCNIFEDGRVCMGDLVRGNITGSTLAECFKNAIESFSNTYWNGEIASNQANVRRMFRWDSSRKQVAPEANWNSYCAAISRVEMEELCPA